MDAIREEERVRMAQNTIIISSDDESDSGRRQIPPKPVTSYNKASIFPAKQNSDNEETPLENSSGTLHIETRNFRRNQAVTYKVWLLGY